MRPMQRKYQFIPYILALSVVLYFITNAMAQSDLPPADIVVEPGVSDGERSKEFEIIGRIQEQVVR